MITAGEETGCEGAFHLLQDKALGRAGAVVVAEPTSNYPFVGHKGAFWLRAKATGVTAHGSMPDKGVNAIYKAARAVGKLEAFRFQNPPHDLMGQATLNVGTIRGGLNINSVPDEATVGDRHPHGPDGEPSSAARRADPAARARREPGDAAWTWRRCTPLPRTPGCRACSR